MANGKIRPIVPARTKEDDGEYYIQPEQVVSDPASAAYSEAAQASYYVPTEADFAAEEGRAFETAQASYYAPTEADLAVEEGRTPAAVPERATSSSSLTLTGDRTVDPGGGVTWNTIPSGVSADGYYRYGVRIDPNGVQTAVLTPVTSARDANVTIDPAAGTVTYRAARQEPAQQSFLQYGMPAIVSGLNGFAQYLIMSRQARIQRQINRETIDANRTLAEEAWQRQTEVADAEEESRRERDVRYAAVLRRNRASRTA